jgi:Phage stabilisation protein
MPIVPLGVGAYRRNKSFQPDVEMLNLLLEADDSNGSPDKFFRIGRPGYSLYYSLPAAIKGLYRQDRVFGGDVFAVAGFSLYRNQNLVGSVGSGNAAFAPGIDLLAIVTDPTFYLYDGTNTVRAVLPDSNVATDVDQLNSYLVVACRNGRFYWLEPGQTVFDPLNFATAESAPDGLIAVRRLVDELWFFGVSSIEVWQATGDVNAPFSRAGGRQYERGCLFRDTVRRFDNAIVWVGEDNIVYRTSNSPLDIGTPWLSERIAKRGGDLSAFMFGFDDHKLYVLRIPGQGSFAYDASTQEWSEFRTDGATEWHPHVACDLPVSTLVGNFEAGDVWLIDTDAATDDGKIITRRVSGSIALQGRPARTPNISLGVGVSADCTVNIRWKDAREDYPAYYEEIQALAPADIVNVFRCGQAQQPFRTFEVMINDPVLVRISAMRVGDARA